VSWMFCAGLFSIADLLAVDRKVLTVRSVLSLLLAAQLAPPREWDKAAAHASLEPL